MTHVPSGEWGRRIPAVYAVGDIESHMSLAGHWEGGKDLCNVRSGGYSVTNVPSGG